MNKIYEKNKNLFSILNIFFPGGHKSVYVTYQKEHTM